MALLSSHVELTTEVAWAHWWFAYTAVENALYHRSTKAWVLRYLFMHGENMVSFRDNKMADSIYGWFSMDLYTV